MTKRAIIIVFAILTLMSCKNETKKPEAAETIVETTMVEVNKTETVQNFKVGSQVPNDLVWMVNNA
jgi:PBP1b-binding outer membrane lipoprotein LpoB